MKKTVHVLEDQPDRQERQGLECSSRTRGCFYYALCLYLVLTQSTCSEGVKQPNLKLRGKVNGRLKISSQNGKRVNVWEGLQLTLEEDLCALPLHVGCVILQIL